MGKNEPQQRQKANDVEILIGNGVLFAKTVHIASVDVFVHLFFKEMNTMTMLMCSAHNRAGQKKSREFMKAIRLNHPSVAKETQYYCVIECNVSRSRFGF